MILISFISSLSTLFIKNDKLIYRLFSIFLLTTFIIESVANQMAERKQNNIFIYNLFSVLEFCFYFFFFHSVLKGYLKKIKGSVIIILYLALALVNIFLIQGKNNFHTYTYILGCIICIILSITYFYFLFKYSTVSNLIKDPVFWISAALLLYYSCTLPVFGILNFLTNLAVPFYTELAFIIEFMNIALYLLFAIGFICRINIRKYMF
jgi:uncharacterized membrane protein YidH (DUF202 family)